MTRNPRPLLFPVILCGLHLAACGGDDDTSLGTADGTSTSAPASAAVQVRDTASLGKVLAAADGMTLYTFSSDPAGKSNCSGPCASTWPPLIVRAAPAKPDGVSGDFTLVIRDDGQKQLALNGKPLYRYAADRGPGDTTGEGVGGVWFAAKLSAAATPASDSGAYGY